MRMRAAFLSVAVGSFFLIACGGNEPPPASPAPPAPSTPSPSPATEKKSEHDEHGAMAPALHDFHEVLAGMWHATPGSERISKTCGGQKELAAKADAVGDAELKAATDAVKTACDKPDHAEVEVKLGVVHDRFHRLAEAH